MVLVAVGGTANPRRAGDVIFIHGLAGDPRKTWSCDGEDGFWPAWLARERTGIGVWSVGYQVAATAWRGTAMPLFDRANNVLAELSAAGIGSRPVCFIAHSMGGLMVKYMLRNAYTLAPEFAPIAKSVRGVIFFATPHAGSDAALVRYLKFLRPSIAIRELESNAPALRELNQWYRENAPDLGLATSVFFETRKTAGLQIVDAASADPGLRGVTPIGVDADHGSIVKPRSPQDLVYLRCRQFIDRVFAVGDTQDVPVGDASRPFLVPQLPPQGVVGREGELRDIARLLGTSSASAASVPPLVLRGMGGIGKTTLALATGWNQDIGQHFPDGVLWTELGPNPVTRSLLNGWGTALGVDLVPLPDEMACRDRLRDILSGKRMLLIVDDVWEPRHGDLFQVAGPYGRLLFTTREPPVANALTVPSHILRVDVLAPEASLALLATFVPQAVADEPEAARRLCERVEQLPLALKLAGRLLANEAEVPRRMRRLVDELAERGDSRLALQQAEGRRGLPEGAVSLKDILGLSVERLNPVDRTRFAMTAVFGGEPLTWELDAAAAVWACAAADAEKTTSHLIQRGLVERWNRGHAGPGERYWTHALLADYAADMMRELEL